MTFFLFKVFLFLFLLFFFVFLLQLFPFSPPAPFVESFPSCFFHIILLVFIHPLLLCFLQLTFYFIPVPSSILVRLLFLPGILLPLFLYLTLQSPLIPSHTFLRFFSSLAQSVQWLRNVVINREIRADGCQGQEKFPFSDWCRPCLWSLWPT